MGKLCLYCRKLPFQKKLGLQPCREIEVEAEDCPIARLPGIRHPTGSMIRIADGTCYIDFGKDGYDLVTTVIRQPIG